MKNENIYILEVWIKVPSKLRFPDRTPATTRSSCLANINSCLRDGAGERGEGKGERRGGERGSKKTEGVP